jgi:hypothetical protein
VLGYSERMVREIAAGWSPPEAVEAVAAAREVVAMAGAAMAAAAATDLWGVGPAATARHALGNRCNQCLVTGRGCGRATRCIRQG